jgi:hypothetical protein
MGDNPDHSPHIDIVLIGKSKSGLTNIWRVVNTTKEDDSIGIIRWHGPWRGYVYECEASFYDAKCLTQIADFIKVANQDHKQK